MTERDDDNTPEGEENEFNSDSGKPQKTDVDITAEYADGSTVEHVSDADPYAPGMGQETGFVGEEAIGRHDPVYTMNHTYGHAPHFASAPPGYQPGPIGPDADPYEHMAPGGHPHHMTGDVCGLFSQYPPSAHAPGPGHFSILSGGEGSHVGATAREADIHAVLGGVRPVSGAWPGLLRS